MNPSNNDQSQKAQPADGRAKPRSGKWLIIGLVLAIVLVLAVAAVLFVKNRNDQAVNANPAATIDISKTAFSPATVKIKKGQSVTWVNDDTVPHQVAADPYPTHASLPELHSTSLNQGDSYTFTFEKKGTFTYQDPLYPTTLKATVVVE